MQNSALQDAARIAYRSLYRDIYRECQRFPDEKTRIYFLSKARDDFASKEKALDVQKRSLRWLQAANAGYLHAVTRCMELAYARRGKPKRRRIETLLQEARSIEAVPLVPGKPRTRPPLYTPRLQGYLTSQYSYSSGKAPTAQQLKLPPSLPARADPQSEEARLLGPLPLNREANIRWRHFANLRDRLVAPISQPEADELSKLAAQYQKPQQKKEEGSRTIPDEIKKRLQGYERIHEHQKAWSRPKNITSRFMRRRYEALMDEAVQLDAKITQDDKVKWSAKQPDGHRSKARQFVASSEDLQWSPPLT